MFARDGWACQYCGSRSNLTVDHVIPRSKGGAVELGEHRRLVRAVQPPQGRPHLRQANMHPRRAPRAPSPQVFIHVASPTIPAAWRQYLRDAACADAPAAGRRLNDEGRRRRGALRVIR